MKRHPASSCSTRSRVSTSTTARPWSLTLRQVTTSCTATLKATTWVGCMPRSPSAEGRAASATQRTAAGGLSGIGRLTPRRPILGDLRLGRRLGWVIPMLIVLVTAIVGYNARAIGQQRGSALVVYTAARQRALVERYTKDVLVVVDGFKADPKESGEAMR